jgi:hypothetical protein
VSRAASERRNRSSIYTGPAVCAAPKLRIHLPVLSRYGAITTSLPPAVSSAQTYWMCADPTRSIDQVLAVNLSERFLARIWDDVEVVARVDLAEVNPRETPCIIALCRKPKLTMAKLWPRIRPW